MNGKKSTFTPVDTQWAVGNTLQVCCTLIFIQVFAGESKNLNFPNLPNIFIVSQ